MEHVHKALAELKGKRDTLNAAILSLEAVVRGHGEPTVVETTPVQPVALLGDGEPAKRQRKSGKGGGTKAQRKSPRQVGRKAAGGVPNLNEKMRLVVAGMEQPFDAHQVQEAMLTKYPDVADKLRDGYVRGTLQHWSDTGELLVHERGRPHYPAKFRRAEAFAVSGSSGRSFARQTKQEVAYNQFRATVKMPEPVGD